MNNNNEISLEEMSGETRSAPRLELNELSFSGKKGSFTLIDRKGGLVTDDKGKKKFAQIPLGEDVKVVFLRVRRKLRQFRKDEKPLTTNEHNTKYDMLTLFGNGNIEKGTNDALREKYPLLKTNQIVYCLLLKENSMPELVRMTVKGSSLGSESKAKETETIYSYMYSFKKDGADEHFYEWVTELFAVEEATSLGSYYSMTFRKGVKLTDKQMEVVKQNMKIVFDHITASDAYYQTKTSDDLNKEKAETVVNDNIDTISYDDDEDEDINPDDIPF